MHFLIDEAQKARDLLASAEQVAILLPAHPPLDAFVAAEVFARVLEGRDKYVAFLPNVAADALTLPEIFARVRNPHPIIRERIIAIDTAHAPVAQLRYEKHDERIDIVLSPKSIPIREDAFSFREGKILCDALITIAVPEIEDVSVEALGLTPHFFTDTPIINIGNAEGHQQYGEINLLAPRASLSEIATVCVKAMDDKAPDAEMATLLLAGVISDSRNFAAPVGAGTHLAAADLLQCGADYARAASLAGEDKPFSLLQLIARASVRSKETDEGRVLWSFLTAEDFQKTTRSPQDATAVMEALPRFFPAHTTTVLLWQDPRTREIRSIIRAEREVLLAIAEREPGTMGNPLFIPHAAFAHFMEAEEYIGALLPRAIEDRSRIAEVAASGSGAVQ